MLDQRPSPLLAAALALAIMGCRSTGRPETCGRKPVASSGDPSCARFIAPSPALRLPTGLILPTGRVTFTPAPSRLTGPIRRGVFGFVDLTPTQVVEGLRRAPGVTIDSQENEGFEAEVLVHNAQASNYWRIRRVCRGVLLASVIVQQR